MNEITRKRLSRSTGRVRIDDVARVARVSPQTVSRYFRSPEKVAPATRDRIQKAIENVGYVPNLIAGSLASNRTNAIGIIVPTIANPVHSAPVQGLSDVMRAANHQVLLGSTGYDEKVESELVAAFLGRRLDGLVVTGISHETGAREMLERANIPVVEIWELPDHPIDMAVGFSNLDAGATVAAHLFEQGYRKLAVAAHASKNDTRSLARQLGFSARAEALGLAPPKIQEFDGPPDINTGVDVMRKITERNHDIDAIFAVSDLVALGILLFCRETAIRVPQQLAVAGFGESGYSMLISPGLTTIRVPGYELGRTAGELLLSKLDGLPIEEAVVDVGYKLVIRQST